MRSFNLLKPVPKYLYCCLIITYLPLCLPASLDNITGVSSSGLKEQKKRCNRRWRDVDCECRAGQLPQFLQRSCISVNHTPRAITTGNGGKMGEQLIHITWRNLLKIRMMPREYHSGCQGKSGQEYLKLLPGKCAAPFTSLRASVGQ